MSGISSKRTPDARIRALVTFIAERSNIRSMGPRVFAPEIWSENFDEAVRFLSVASFGSRDVFASNLAIVTHGANVGVAFSFGDFLLATQKKVTAARGISALLAKIALHFTAPSP